MTRKRFNQIIFSYIEVAVGILDVFFVRKPKTIQKNTLLIIKLDAIGDYVLFRNYLKSIKESDKFKGYEIHLLGNILWKSISEKYDADYINKFIWINPGDFHLKPAKHYKIVKELNSLDGYEYIFQPTFSRIYSMDKLVRLIRGKHKIAPKGNRRNTHYLPRFISNTFYTELYNIENPELFELYKNRQIVEGFIKEPVKNFLFSFGSIQPKNQDENYVAIFPDAAVSYRRWHIDNFLQIINFIIKNSSLKVKIVGTNNEIKEYLDNLELSPNVENLMRKTSLTETIEILASAKLTISNDSGLAHISAVVDTPTICISNGNHYGRFVPYPADMNKDLKLVIPSLLWDKFKNEDVLIKKLRNGSLVDINLIKPAEVIPLVKDYL